MLSVSEPASNAVYVKNPKTVLEASSTLVLRNTCAVEGTLYINLQSYPEFTLAAAESLDAGDVGFYFESLK